MHIIKHRTLFFILPALFFALSAASVALFGLKGGVDLKGGALLEVRFSGERPAAEEVLRSIEPLALGEVRVQPSDEQGYIIRTRDLSQGEKDAIIGALTHTGSLPLEQRFTSIGPTIGKELRSKAWIAIVLVSVVTVLYIAFAFRHVSLPVASWKYGIIAIVTLMHDVLIPLGLFALLGEVRGAEVDSLFIVALLAILGISINDTIVVFDRVRENLRMNNERKLKEPFETTVGKSIDQTIARSINTSVTVIVVLVALFLFGPDATQNFALTLIVGMVAGTYSSIFLASPLLVVWEKVSHTKK